MDLWSSNVSKKNLGQFIKDLSVGIGNMPNRLVNGIWFKNEMDRSYRRRWMEFTFNFDQVK